MTHLPDLKPALELIRRYQKIAVVSHFNPDADAYGSACGLAIALKSIGKRVTVYNESGVVSRYLNVPGVVDINGALPEQFDAETLLIMCDCGAAERVGEKFLPTITSTKPLLNIDHHTQNSMFGSENLVIESASSTSEIIYHLLKEILPDPSKLPLDSARALLTGIIGDTGSFRYPSTSPETFLVAYELTKLGAHPSDIVQRLFGNISLPALRLQTESLNKISLSHNGAFAEVVVPTEMVERLGADILDADSLAERARDVQGVCIAALYKQDGEIWRVSLRSRGPEWDISEIARSFGGGGHKPAAAFRWRKDFATLQSSLHEKISELLARHPAK